MAYNSSFPMTYQSFYPQYTPTHAPQSPNSSIIWVQGEAGAKSYLVAPNSTVQLWDSESQTIYLKSADASGMPSIKILDYTVRSESKNDAPKSVREVTQDDIKLIQDQIDKIREELGMDGKAALNV